MFLKRIYFNRGNMDFEAVIILAPPKKAADESCCHY